MGQSWYGVPPAAGEAALIRQANEASFNNADIQNDSSATTTTPTTTTPADPKFVQKLVEEAAAQVYEDVHLQLKNIQEESLMQTQKMAKELSAKLKPLDRACQKENALCTTQRSVLLACLQNQQKAGGAYATLNCEDAVQAYHVCSLSDS